MKKYIFLVANLNHISVEALRKRGEIFAHFWYQAILNPKAAGSKMFFFTSFDYLKKEILLIK